jgi:hypothetical protein
MALSRPLPIALLAAVLAAVGFYASGAGRESSSDSSVVAPTPVEPAPTKNVREAGKPEVTKASVSAAERKETAADRAQQRSQRAARQGAPRPVRRALDARKTVVLFFFKHGSADDAATARAVAAVRGMRGVSVFTAPIAELGSYQAVVGPLGISQAPAVVIVGKGRRTRLTEGFIDVKAFRQDVLDMR